MKSTVVIVALLSGVVFAEPLVNGRKVAEPLLKEYPHLREIQGRYWHDCRSGLWGTIGGMAMGQLPPDLQLNCESLDSQASGGQTNVFINGRAIHPMEWHVLAAMFGHVPDGYYWLEFNGQGGVEGDSTIRFNLALPSTQQHQDSSTSALEGWGRDWIGNVVGDGTTSGYISSEPGGISVTCGPDGGCIY